MRRALDLSFGDSNTADREAKDSETESANSREELAGLIPNVGDGRHLKTAMNLM